MIVTSKEGKATSLIDLLGGSGKTKESKIGNAFAQLLSTLGEVKKEGKTVKEGEFATIIDVKKNTTGDTKAVNSDNLKAKAFEELLMGKEEHELFSKELIHAISTDQVQSLIHKAKAYLKQEIMKSPNHDSTKEIPKTLMGLVELADKIGINLSEITLTTIDTEAEHLLKELPAPFRSMPILDVLSAKPSETPNKPFESIMQILKEMKPVEVLSDDAPTRKEVIKHVGKEAPLQVLLKGLEESGMVATQEVSKEVPKASMAPVQFEALTTLLSGEIGHDHVSKENLKEVKTEIESNKTHQPLKVDSLEVKAKEAVQSLRHFAQDMKEAVENYKPPFTRITMKLNPERLGEVDVTLIQRGNNVHVNIQSQNTNSIAFLAHNASELKAQLAHNGITNATMNFMSGGNENQQHHSQQHEQNRFRAYQSFEELEQSQEELSALELIIPHYA